jgi:hypothetical protein
MHTPEKRKTLKSLIQAFISRTWKNPVIPATWEAEIRRIQVQGQPRKTV